LFQQPRPSALRQVWLPATAIGCMCVAAGLLYAGLKGSTNGSVRPTRAATADARDRLDAFLKENMAIIEEMPRHEQSEQVYRHFVQLWKDESDLSEFDATRAIAFAFPDSPLGLFACDHYLAMCESAPASNGAEHKDPTLEFLPPELVKPGQILFCWEMWEAHPDSRLGCFVLDKLIHLYEAQDAVKACDMVINRQRNTRSGGFALVSKGDLLYQANKLKLAERTWLDGWQLFPTRAPEFFEKLSKIWVERGDWICPLLFDPNLLDQPVWLDVIQRVNQRDRVLPASVLKAVAGVKAALNSEGLSALSAAFKTLNQVLHDPEIPPAHAADIALAAFLLDTKPFVSSVTVSGLIVKSKLEELRGEMLKSALAFFTSLTPDMQAAFRMRIAGRMLVDVQIDAAADILEAGWKDASVSTFWRRQALGRVVQIFAREKAQPLEAAERLIQYAERYPGERADMLVRAGAIYFCAGKIQKAEPLLDEIGEPQLDGQPELAAQVCFLKGACRLKGGDVDGAKSLFARLLNVYPSSPYTANAFQYLAADALGKGERQEAEEYLEQARSRFPDFQFDLETLPPGR